MPFALAAILLSVFFLFQNCSQVGSIQDVQRLQKSTTAAAGGNGGEYDGKLFVHIGLCGNDPNANESEIWVPNNGTTAKLLRQQCQYLPVPQEIPKSELVLLPGGDLVYATRTYLGVNVASSSSGSGAAILPTPTPELGTRPTATPTPDPGGDGTGSSVPSN